mmetsp:Transcript_21726/g.30699  ORF Transcript_21726/g.30699 Transcript_21726/m.30699 type:complete len:89 (+) Transcript_21726:2761-3027(+)
MLWHCAQNFSECDSSASRVCSAAPRHGLWLRCIRDDNLTDDRAVQPLQDFGSRDAWVLVPARALLSLNSNTGLIWKFCPIVVKIKLAA